MNIKKNWLHDIAFDIVKRGEIRDEQVINQSIENILFTTFGERPFRPGFGSGLIYQLGETLDERTGEQLINSIANSIKRWEPRITLNESEVRLIIKSNNAIQIIIPYRINRTNVVSKFDKTVRI